MAISIKCRDIIGCRWHRGSWLIHNHHDGNLGLTLNLPASWMWSATPGPHWWRSRTSAALQARVIVETVKPVPAPSQDIVWRPLRVVWYTTTGIPSVEFSVSGLGLLDRLGQSSGAACESLNRRLSRVNGKASTVTIIGPGHSTQTIVSGHSTRTSGAFNSGGPWSP